MKKNKRKLENNITKKNDIIINNYEESIISAYKRIKQDEYNENRIIIEWMAKLLKLLMIFFIIVLIVIGYVFVRLLINNLQNNIWLSFYNFDFIGIIIIGIVLIIYTYRVNKHIDDIKNITDITGLSSFLLSSFAVLISLLALLKQ